MLTACAHISPEYPIVSRFASFKGSRASGFPVTKDPAEARRTPNVQLPPDSVRGGVDVGGRRRGVTFLIKIGSPAKLCWIDGKQSARRRGRETRRRS